MLGTTVWTIFFVTNTLNESEVPQPSMSLPRIAIIGDYTYDNTDVIRSTIRTLPKPSTLVLTSKTGVCRIAADEARVCELFTTFLDWACKPGRITEIDELLLFYNGTSSYWTPLFRHILRQRFPFLALDPAGNPVDFSRLIRPTIPTMPIIDNIVGTRVRITIAVPEALYDKYAAQGKAEGVTAEKEIADRLTRTADFTDTRGLWFNSKQRNELERITGGHLIENAEQALSRIRTTAQVKVGEVTVQLDERLTQRVHSRAKAFRKTPEKWLAEETRKGLEVATGMRPA